MQDLNVIDQFMESFVRYIDSGFGLLGPEVGFLTTVLIGIDITLAGLFWALGGEDDVIARFIKKILYVGVFALILNQFSTLTDIIFRSFAGLGLTAGGSTISAEDLLRPGRLAGTGVLIKGGSALERLAGVTAFAFDKTGTLTEGKLELGDVVGLGGVPPGEVLRAAATAEQQSEHPLARVILREASALGFAPPPPEFACARRHLLHGIAAAPGPRRKSRRDPSTQTGRRRNHHRIRTGRAPPHVLRRVRYNSASRSKIRVRLCHSRCRGTSSGLAAQMARIAASCAPRQGSSKASSGFASARTTLPSSARSMRILSCWWQGGSAGGFQSG